MLHFLIQRPIAVMMTFLALVILGGVVFTQLPISLLPQIPIPKISVQVQYPNVSARELEDVAIRPLRNQLLQTSHLKDIYSKTQNGLAHIYLEFDFGTNTNLAFLEVNEKIDQIMSRLPREMPRPLVLKAQSGDIPVLNISVLPKPKYAKDLLDLSQLSRNVIKRRIEQISEVSFVDVSGFQEAEIILYPKEDICRSLGITQEDIKRVIVQNNINLGNVLIQDGQYQYNIRFLSQLKSVSDVENIHLKIDEHILQIKDIAKVKTRPQTPRGTYLYNGKEAIIFAIHKKADANLFDLKAEVAKSIAVFQADYPELDFHTTQDQSEILDISLSNLESSLLYGGTFAFLVMFLFFREWRSPVLIGIAIPVSLAITLLGFYLLDISINIISLSGLILGVGLMIDNSIIVIENVMQSRKSFPDAPPSITVAQGANEVIKPLISSALTTCSVFLPLIFLNGIAGVLFYDQALSISIALFSSLLVAYFLLPTLLLLGKGKTKKTQVLKSKNKLYSRSVDFCIRYRWVFLVLCVAIVSYSSYFLIQNMPTRSLPPISTPSLTLDINWNEPISITENTQRLLQLYQKFEKNIATTNMFIGEQKFLLQPEQNSIQESTSHWIFNRFVSLALQDSIRQELSSTYPTAAFSIYPSKNILDEILSTNTPAFVVHVQTNDNQKPELAHTQYLSTFFKENQIPIVTIPTQEELVVHIDKEKLLLYNISFDHLHNTLQSILDKNNIGKLQFSNYSIPISIGMNVENISQKLETTLIKNQQGKELPLQQFISFHTSKQLKNITGNKSGESIDIVVPTYKKGLLEHIRSMDIYPANISVHFSGQIFKDQENIQSLLVILGISLLLLFLILAAQFESLVLPFIVLLSVPFGAMGSLTCLYILGQSINLLSLIGIIVMSGIVINDAILKVDMMKKATPHKGLIPAIHEAGRRRMKPIIMTSLTTILAIIPITLASGIGAEFQRPLAYAVLGGLILGTLASLYLIPVLYFTLGKTKK